MYSSPVSNTLVTCDRFPNGQVPKKVDQWLGREVHYAKKSSHIMWQAMAGAVILAVGVLLLAHSTILGAILMAGGALLGFSAIVKEARGNQLEKAVQHLVGGKLEKLPALNWSEVLNRKREVHECAVHDLIEAMSSNVMRATYQGRTHGLAVKYDTVKNGVCKTKVRLYFFQEPFGDMASGSRDLNDIHLRYRTHDKLPAKKARMLEQMIQQNNFLFRK